MPEELRGLSRDADPKLKANAAEWRKKHCWRPNQLRHFAATAIRAVAGIETAQMILGHSELKTSEIYAERDLAAAAEVMRTPNR